MYTGKIVWHYTVTLSSNTASERESTGQGNLYPTISGLKGLMFHFVQYQMFLPTNGKTLRFMYVHDMSKKWELYQAVQSLSIHFANYTGIIS